MSALKKLRCSVGIFRERQHRALATIDVIQENAWYKEIKPHRLPFKMSQSSRKIMQHQFPS
ncbi:MAG: hypothetical protein ABJN98_09370 [Roseibium sp.]